MHTLPQDVDYIDGGGMWLPTLGTLQLSLQPVYSRKKLDSFGWKQYATGGLIGNGFL
jgi:hypothetical protein